MHEAMYVLGNYFDDVKKAVGEKSATAVFAQELFAQHQPAKQNIVLRQLIERNKLLQMVH